MYNIQTLNKISPLGLELFKEGSYNISDKIDNPDAILVRSYVMHDMELPKSLKAIARAGAGVNNIPIDKCSEKGIVVFNTPGANANAVKELTVAALLLSSRKIIEGIQWAKSLAGEGANVPKLVEKGKADFTGPEILGKKLGVIGLGAIGVMVANAANSLGMEVTGFDPYISVDAAWGLSRNVKKAPDFRSLLENSDYITLHVPLTGETKDLINYDKFSLMKKGVRLLNFSRAELVNNEDLKRAIQEGIVDTYVTDFPSEELLNMEHVIAIPHLGASTPESEDNCAVMAANQLRDFLENGNITNSVNFPSCELNRSSDFRVTVAHKNIPNMVGQISTILAKEQINILNMINRSKGNLAYTIIDAEENIPEDVVCRLQNIEGVLSVRII
ncbi:MAG: D-3-phosphoglycerate dehydrogenase / 2-oxoglutarate reductase [Petroclostridium sp.]|jgi:D-3-phosphoglycerate dehydrogenase|uniref:phosphoglycerate dehydrogenase n=1 Tax=Petroclostridium xylanilyticum TaxID=1792311 RepID=UPI000B98E101|nr:phosphoglycerate dehydrogenase [Petroclostridium xylanilyticum]MBZ4645549.1 phosphoglycerate dehydrogenase-like oxidoreductase [Clostridia bacterium]MDK2811183.1 D-3-phosphoglycerate dehydrogenase / 2-oxoglutarate reductase [Petroclostridium sp.]